MLCSTVVEVMPGTWHLSDKHVTQHIANQTALSFFIILLML